MIKKIIIGAVITAAMVMIPAPVFANTVRDDGNEWLTKCVDDSYTNQGWCLGYTQSLSHGADMVELTLKSKVYCWGSRTVTVGQMRDIMKAYLYRNPAKRSDQMMFVYFDAMKEAFPCK